MVDILLASQSYRRKAGGVSRERLVNMYPQMEPPSAAEPVVLKLSHGISDFATCGTGPIRGIHTMGGVPYVVSGADLYSVSSAGVATHLGGGILGTAPVAMDDNGLELAIVNGLAGYLYSVSGGFVAIGDVDFQNGAKSVTNLDGFLAFDWPGTGKFFVSASVNGASYPALAYGTAATKSDLVVAVRNVLQRLLIMGQKSIEMWANVGLANMPFERIPGAVSPRGIAASGAHTEEDGKLYFIGEDKAAYRLMDISAAEKISTAAMEEAWASYAKFDDVFMFSYRFAGHAFVVVTFPTVPATWVFDVSTGVWHERTSRDATGQLHARWRVNCAAVAFGRVLVGDSFSGKVGYLDDDVFTEFGQTMLGELITPPIHGKNKRVFQQELVLDLDAGRALSTGQGSDPQVMVDISDDGGQTWTGPQLWGSAGQIGEHTKQLYWHNLGSFYKRAFRFTFSDPIRWTIIAARGEFGAEV